MDGIKLRLTEFVEFKGLSKREFCKAIDVSPTFLANNSEISSDKVLNIINAYPDISLDWLITGNGEMIRQDEHSEVNAIIKNQQETIFNLSETIKNLTSNKERV